MSSIISTKIKKGDTLPNGLKISTMTITCRFDTQFRINNIGKYLDLSENSVLSVKYKNKEGDSCMRSLIPVKKKAKKRKSKNKPKKKKESKVFYNQATVKIKTTTKEKPINVKLFKNGSIQMTGCNSIENAVECMAILCQEFKTEKGVLNKKMNKIKNITFVTNLDNLNVKKILDFNVGMINSNFDIGFKVDRDALYEIMLSNNAECTYEPCVHACVNIKFDYKGIKNISVFVFESGSIIITGARDKDQIIQAYRYITAKLCENYNTVIKKDLDAILLRKDVKKMVFEANKMWRQNLVTA
jgi:TATA-box binding protein (TBP) (component of TFIID and TFIIIB)